VAYKPPKRGHIKQSGGHPPVERQDSKRSDHGMVGFFYRGEYVNMMNIFSRLELLIGKKGLDILKNKTIGVFGIGGVGSFSVEALARCGIGKLILIDKDNICITNINRQIHALNSTIGRPKVEVMAERIKDINPSIEVVSIQEFYSCETSRKIFNYNYDYIIDAIDTITAKIHLIATSVNKGIPIISSMGAGNKIDPTKFQVSDISDTKICPMARIIRKELRKKGICQGVKVVYSTELPIKPKNVESVIPGSISFVPSTAGLIIAGEVVKDILRENKICKI